MEHFGTVAQQVVILFVLIAVGYVLGKLKIMNDAGARVCADIAIFVATPCAIINSFRREADATVWLGLLAAFGAGVLCHVIAIGVAHLIFRKNAPRDRVLRVGTVMTNAGFMAFPLQLAILGELGLFYGAVFVVVHNLVLWSYGQISMDRKNGRPNARKLLLNPGTVSLAVGILVMLLPVDLPAVIAGPIEHFSNLCTPVPMLFIGYTLSKVDLLKMFKKPIHFAFCGVRLVLAPALAVAAMYLIGLRGTLLIAMTIATAAPTATTVAMFASRYEQDEETSVNIVALSTLLSLISMPILVALVQTIGG